MTVSKPTPKKNEVLSEAKGKAEKKQSKSKTDEPECESGVLESRVPSPHLRKCLPLKCSSPLPS